MTFTSQLQQATMELMIQNLLPKDEEKRLKDMFLQIDTDKSGQIDRDELLEGMAKLHGSSVKAKDEVDRIFQYADADGSGKISFSEFKSAFVQKELLLQEDKLKEMFNKYDED